MVTLPGASDPCENFGEKSWMFVSACWMAAMGMAWMVVHCVPSRDLDLVGHHLIGHVSARRPTDLPMAVALEPSGAPQIGTPFGRRAVLELAQ